MWFVQLIPQIESNGYSITPGRFDQYMYPFYTRDVEQGTLSQQEAQELLDCYWLKCNEIIRVDDKGAAEINAGYAAGQNLTVGGVGIDGHDVTNEISYMCLAANTPVHPPPSPAALRGLLEFQQGSRNKSLRPSDLPVLQWVRL